MTSSAILPLRNALESAGGEPSHIIIIFANIRAFSSFSKDRDAMEVAAYVRRVYICLIDAFPDATFVKATGDGLLTAIGCDSSDVGEKLAATVTQCLEIDRTFASITSHDVMVNFQVPQFIGFGIARGTAYGLISDGSVLDYSGHRLNLAARLVDLARPHGIVIDGEAGIDMLDSETRGRFEPKNVYIRGIAEAESRAVLVQRDAVVLPRSSQVPIADEPWETETRDMTAGAVRSFVPVFREDIAVRALPKSLIVQFMFSAYNDGQPADFGVHFRCESFEYHELGAGQEIRIETAELIACLEEHGVPDNGRVHLQVDYLLKVASP